MDPLFLMLICIFQCIAITAICVMIRGIVQAYYQYKTAKFIAPYKFPWKYSATTAPRPKPQTLNRADMLAEMDQLRREQKKKGTALRKEFEAAKHQFLQRIGALSEEVTAKNAKHEACTQCQVAEAS